MSSTYIYLPSGSSGGGAVDSVFSRIGVVSASNGDYTAAQVTNTPSGGVSATDVQAAITQLDTAIATKGSGTVTSVALSTPGVVYSVSGTPITGSGTLALSLISQAPNVVLAGPTSGGSANPSFRSIVAADVPILNQNTTGTASNITASSNSSITTLSSLSLPGSQVSGDIGGNAANVTGTVAIVNGGTGQTTANTALNALLPDQTSASGNFLQSNGTNTAWVAVAGGSMPSAHLSSTGAVTSATTTFVTAISTTITTTVTAPIYAHATGVFTVTSAVPTVTKYRVSINGVAGQEQLLSLTALTTNYTAAVQYISASLAPGTYTVLFEFARNSGTGTVNFFEGTLDALGLQGGNSNGITQLTGALQAGPGSGSQVLSGILPLANGGTAANLTATNGAVIYSTASAFGKTAAGSANQILQSAGAASPTWSTATYPATTTINQLLYSSSANVIGGLATTNTGALVTSSTGVPSLASGITANRLLRTNGTTVSFAQANLTTDVTGTLPAANGGTGVTAFASQRIPFGTGTSLTTDGSFIYDTVNKRLSVNGSGTAIGNFINTGSSVALQAYNAGTNNAFQAMNQSAFSVSCTNRSDSNITGASIGLEFGRGTLAVPLQALSGDQLGVIVPLGYTGTQTAPGYGGAISFVAAENVTNTAIGCDLVFATTPIGTLVPIENIRVKNSGETVFQKAIQTAQYTTVAKLALTAVMGWVVFDTTLNQLSYYNGTTWINL